MEDFFSAIDRGIWRLIALVCFGGLLGGIINRVRGWGDGWNGTGEPKWLVWVQKYLFNREVLAILFGLIVGMFCLITGHDKFWSWMMVPLVAITWRFGITFGWGDYFDGVNLPNHEIAWIDSLVEKRLRPWMRSRKSAWWRARADSPNFIDCVSFGLRDVYYIPMFICLWPVAHWWILLPIAFFWQDAVIYHWCRRYIYRDYTAAAEASTGDLRTVFMLSAIVLG